MYSKIGVVLVAIKIQTPVMVHQIWISRHMTYICLKKSSGQKHCGFSVPKIIESLPKQQKKTVQQNRSCDFIYISCDPLRLDHLDKNHLSNRPEAQTLQHLQVGDKVVGCLLKSWGGWVELFIMEQKHGGVGFSC